MNFYEKLLNGDYVNGWPSHDQIVSCSPEKGFFAASSFNKPIWNGDCEPITLLINAEFGDGDTIHFYRFVKEAKKRVSKVILRCNEDFKTLFSDTEIVGKNEDLPLFDKIIHMMALPKALNITEFSGEAYLKSKIDLNYKFSDLKNNIGVCWAGNPFNPKDRFRSIDLDLFSESTFVKGVAFFSLNNMYTPHKDYIDLRSFMKTWNETAYFIENMDLVITVDTAIAHLAGAMGTPVWTLLSDEDPDWRWGLQGDSTVWYDSMILYRREKSWESILAKLVKDLKET